MMMIMMMALQSLYTATSVGMLNQAAQKFIFMLEKKLPRVWGGARTPCAPWIRP